MKANYKALLALLLVLLLSLAACDTPGKPAEGGQGGTDTPPADAPKLLQFYDGSGYGVITTEGKVIVRGYDYDSTQIWCNAAGEQVAVMQHDPQMSETVRDQWDNPLPESTRFTFFDAWGNTISSVNLDTPGDAEFAYYDGDISTGRVVVCADGAGRYKILGVDGPRRGVSPMRTAPEGYSPDYAAGYARMMQNGELLWVNYDVHNEDWSDWRSYADFYKLDGTPVTLAKDYGSVWTVTDELTGKSLPYMLADYNVAGGTRLTDLLAADGSVKVEGISQNHAITDGLIYCQRGFERGLMDFEGNWVYQESVFTELED